ncbi:Transcriptional regulator, LysR family [Paraburkholderia ribeironis]|uniref:Transcriptional regulator, LysR family n=1 Tax=Paraburkholderia ribeironis TaxID=1247936 RepID=A0A1N7RM05_9BURK|nr:LysR family transcriptional regulator [Paraburkholderia ribeironis]SIT36123.1 Transcriptional regulator, LysR family [Paraburkholderia ribeironis]
MRLRHIEVLLAIMRAGTISKAAELLCISQPAMSKALAQTERSLGFPLFKRAHGRLVPTREAEILFAESHKLQSDIDSLRSLARNLASQPQGYLRVGCLPSLGVSLIPEVVQQFHISRPEVSLRIQTRHTTELITALFTRDLDIGVAVEPPMRPGVTAIELGRTALVCVGPPEDTSPEPIEMAEVVTRNWISIGSVDPLGEFIRRELETLGLDGHVASIEAQTWYVARALAARGIGLTLIDELSARTGADRVSIRPVLPSLSIGVYALWRDGELESQVGKAFVEVLRASVANLGGSVTS